MSFRFRSLISSKITQALHCSPRRAEGLSSNTIIPLIQVDRKDGRQPGFRMLLKDLQDTSHSNQNRKMLLELGSDLVEHLDTDESITGVYLVEDKKDVQLNFKVNYNELASKVIKSTLDKPDSFWQSNSLITQLPPERVVIDFSSPNIAKPFHVGHFRSTVIGNFIANLHTSFGHQVTRINYLGDWGTQFGLLKYGFDKQKMSAEDLQVDAIKKLYQIYVWANKQAEGDESVSIEARNIFNRMEESDSKELDAWKLFRNVSVTDLQQVYSRLNITFDEYHGESMYSAKECQNIINLMEKSCLLRTLDDGRKIYELEPNQRVTIVKSDGSSLYLSRDIAGALDRQEKYKFTKMYYVVDNAQTNHFVALFDIIKNMGFEWAQNMKHVKFGRITGMSTRRGTAVFLQDLLSEAQEIMLKKRYESETTRESDTLSEAETVERLAVSALMIGDLKYRRQKPYEFSWDRALQANGDTGIKLQYVHCRLVSLQERCGVKPAREIDANYLTEPQAKDLIRDIARFDEILVEAYQDLEPCVLVNYLFRFCGKINIALNVLPVKSAPLEIAETRLALFVAARHTLAASLTILGVVPLEKM